MANSYFNHTRIARFTTADAERLNSLFEAISTAFGKLPSVDEINQGTRNFAIATGTVNNYSVTVPFTVSSYTAGLNIRALIPIANSGSSVLNVNGVGQATIKRSDGTNLQIGDLRAMSINEFSYDGSAWRLTSFHGASEKISLDAATSAATSATNSAASAALSEASRIASANSATASAASATTATSALAASAFGLRNLLLNPSFWLSQWLGTGSGAFSGTYTAGTYIRDRWKAGTTGITFSISNYVMTITAGSVQQIVQGRNILQGGLYTLSWTGTAPASVNGITVANGGQITLPSSTNATVTFGIGTLSDPQLEFGPTKTQPERRPVDLERNLCFQYYQRSYVESAAKGALLSQGPHVGLAYSIRYFYHSMIALPVKMRAAPTVSLYSYNQGQLGKADFLTDTPVNIQAIHIGDASFFVESQTNSFGVGGFYYFHWIADAEL